MHPLVTRLFGRITGALQGAGSATSASLALEGQKAMDHDSPEGQEERLGYDWAAQHWSRLSLDQRKYVNAANYTEALDIAQETYIRSSPRDAKEYFDALTEVKDDLISPKHRGLLAAGDFVRLHKRLKEDFAELSRDVGEQFMAHCEQLARKRFVGKTFYNELLAMGGELEKLRKKGVINNVDYGQSTQKMFSYIEGVDKADTDNAALSWGAAFAAGALAAGWAMLRIKAAEERGEERGFAAAIRLMPLNHHQEAFHGEAHRLGGFAVAEQRAESPEPAAGGLGARGLQGLVQRRGFALSR